MVSSTQTGLVPLVEGQQSYDIVFSPEFTSAPSFFDATVRMPSSSGEVFTVEMDAATLSTTGVTVWLSGVPSAASTGGYINWMALGSLTSSAGGGSGTGIKIVQLFHRIGRRARGGDFTKLSLTEQTDIAEAANAALQRLYNVLPPYFKEQTQGFVMPGPLAVTNVGVTQYSKSVTGIAFTSAQFGCTVVLDGDAGWNQIIGESELLNPYMGDTGTVNGTIYGNAIHSDTYPLDRIIGNPIFANQNTAPLYGQQIVRANNTNGLSWWLAQSVGCPQYWWPQVFGNSQGNQPIMVLRMAPAPSQAVAVNVRIAFWPKRLTLADYDANVELTVPDQFIEPCLIPMALAAFMSSPAWQIKGDEDRIELNGEKAEQYARNQYQAIGVPNNRIGCPIGF